MPWLRLYRVSTLVVVVPTRHEESSNHVAEPTEAVFKEALWKSVRRGHNEQPLNDLAFMRCKRLSIRQTDATVLHRPSSSAWCHRLKETAVLTTSHGRHSCITHARLLQQTHCLYHITTHRSMYSMTSSLVVIFLAASDPTYTAVHCQWLCISGGWKPPLKQSVTSAPMLTVFRNHLKTYLFSRSFPSKLLSAPSPVHCV